MLNINPDNTPSHAKSVVTMDGGVLKLMMSIDRTALENKVGNNEVHLKLAKNTSVVFQPCDRGNDHVR